MVLTDALNRKACMESPEQNITRTSQPDQPANGFGRIPDELFGPLCQVSHLGRSVFILLCIKANRYRKRSGKPIGELPHSINDVAMWLGTSRGSIRRALKSLDEQNLIDYWRGGIRVRHYAKGVDHSDPGDHSDPNLDHGDPLIDHGDPPPGSPRSTKSPQLQLNTDSYTPYIGSEEVSEEDTTTVVAELPVKKKPKRSPSWLIWSVEKDKLVTRNGDTNGNQAFMDRWKERLGEEDVIWAEKEAAEKWLRENPEKRIRVKRFDMFFGKWLEKRWEAS